MKQNGGSTWNRIYTHPLFIVMGVDFFQEINQSMYPLKNGAFNALCLVSLKDKINEYFLSSHAPIIKKLPSGLKNFTNTYIVKLKEIMEYKDKKVEYDIVKNYLPNYMRIVLETFLSFKLAIVNDTSDRLPGLSHLINGMIKEFEYIDDIEIDGVNKDGVIKRLNHLKKIADHESHGSIYKAEEFAFISEDELKIFAKNTLQVVNYIDNLHFKKIKGHTA